MNEWKNYGDVNFLQYGGCLVKPAYNDISRREHPALASIYDVFYLNTEAGDSGEDLFAALCSVDISDTWIKKENVLEAIGLEETKSKSIKEIMSEDVFAKECVEYYGVENFSPAAYHVGEYPSAYQDYILTREELKTWLEELGAEAYV